MEVRRALSSPTDAGSTERHAVDIERHLFVNPHLKLVEVGGGSVEVRVDLEGRRGQYLALLERVGETHEYG